MNTPLTRRIVLTHRNFGRAIEAFGTHSQRAPSSTSRYRFISTSLRMADPAGAEKDDIARDQEDWHYRAPYRTHTKDEGFKVVHEGSCHCGRVKYQLSREKPLDAKYCHCTTCQVIHGAFPLAFIFIVLFSQMRLIELPDSLLTCQYRRSIPVGSYL